jgi:hypothetical protein
VDLLYGQAAQMAAQHPGASADLSGHGHHRFRPGDLRRLLRRLACDPGAALAADVGHERDLLRYRRRCADRRRAGGVRHVQIFGLAAVVLASINIFGGFIVSQRMLAMFRKKK